MSIHNPYVYYICICINVPLLDRLSSACTRTSGTRTCSWSGNGSPPSSRPRIHLFRLIQALRCTIVLIFFDFLKSISTDNNCDRKIHSARTYSTITMHSNHCNRWVTILRTHLHLIFLGTGIENHSRKLIPNSRRVEVSRMNE